jgi:hypothetical protein
MTSDSSVVTRPSIPLAALRRESRKMAAAAGHQLSPFKKIPMGPGRTATCACGLYVTVLRFGQPTVWAGWGQNSDHYAIPASGALQRPCTAFCACRHELAPHSVDGCLAYVEQAPDEVCPCDRAVEQES